MAAFNRRTAGTLSVCIFCICFAFFSVAGAPNKSHDCPGEECSICIHNENILKTLRLLSSSIVEIGIIIAVMPLGAAIIGKIPFTYQDSLVSLHIRLDM